VSAVKVLPNSPVALAQTGLLGMLVLMQRSIRKRLVRIVLAVLVLPLLLAGACYLKWSVLDHRLVEITAGEVFQSGAFEPDDLVAVCSEHGIKTVIDLRNEAPEAVAAVADAAQAAGIAHLNLPTLNYPILEEAHAFLVALDQVEKPVLVHCQHGEGRSVMMCAVYRIEQQGWSNAQAFDGTARLPDSLRFLTQWLPSLRRFRAADKKGQFVLNYQVRKPAAAPAPRTILSK
jgi:protein-tyrosine phosphatase